jgi:uncharacterized membrane protein YcaP (DUF421 family)
VVFDAIGRAMFEKTKEAIYDLLELASGPLYLIALVLLVYLIARIGEWSPWLGWWLRVTPMMP